MLKIYNLIFCSRHEILARDHYPFLIGIAQNKSNIRQENLNGSIPFKYWTSSSYPMYTYVDDLYFSMPLFWLDLNCYWSSKDLYIVSSLEDSSRFGMHAHVKDLKNLSALDVLSEPWQKLTKFWDSFKNIVSGGRPR